MKSIIFSFLIAVLFLNNQCTTSEQKPTNMITPQQLEVKKQEILNYIATFNCTESGGCNYLAFGSKACGGPKEYLVFPNTVNFDFLNTKVSEYNALENQYNVQTNAVSDCAMVQAPNTVGCINNLCSIIN